MELINIAPFFTTSLIYIIIFDMLNFFRYIYVILRLRFPEFS